MDDPLLSPHLSRLSSPATLFLSAHSLSFTLSLLASLSRSRFPSVCDFVCCFPFLLFLLILLTFRTFIVRFPLCLSCICSCVRIFVLFITHRLVEVSSTIGRNLDTTRDRRRKHRLARRLCLRILCHRHHHHCHHSHSPIRTHCPVVVGRGAGFPSCSGSDA